MTPTRQYQLNKYYQNEAEAYAKNHHLAQSIQNTQPERGLGFYKPTLFRIGQQLESLGNSLQLRYGDHLKPSRTDC